MIIHGHVLDAMTKLPSDSIDLVVTSPPYYGHRKYPLPDTIWGGDPKCNHEWTDFVRPGTSGGTNSNKLRVKGEDNFQLVGSMSQSICNLCGAWKGQLGREPIFQMYVDHIVMVAAEVKRVLKPTGNFYLNLGDTYSTKSGSGHVYGNLFDDNEYGSEDFKREVLGNQSTPEKSLMNIPHRVAIRIVDELRMAERNDIAWVKPNGLPGSWEDRMTVRKEYVFHFVKSKRYYTNLDAIREPYSDATIERSRSHTRHDKAPYMGQVRSFNNWWDRINAAYDTKYTEGRASAMSKRSAVERVQSRIDAIDLFPEDAEKQQEYINYVHDHGETAAMSKYVSVGSSSVSGNALYKYRKLNAEQREKLDQLSQHLHERMRDNGLDVNRLSEILGIPVVMLRRIFSDTPSNRMIPNRVMWEYMSDTLNLEPYDTFVDPQSEAALPHIDVGGKNPGDVWYISTEGIHEKHIAPYPTKLVARVIAYACPPDGTVLDPFMGSGTTGMVVEAFNHKRWDKIPSGVENVINRKVVDKIDYNMNVIGIELASDYVRIANTRISKVWNSDQTTLEVSI